MSDIEDDYTLEENDTIHVSELEIGDIIEFERKLGPFTYHHCGIYAGNYMIIHKGTAPEVGGVQAIQAKWNNDIGYRIDSIDQVARGSKVYRNNMLDDSISPSKEELILRSKAMYGEAEYDLFYNNCQHFCTKLRYDVAFSRQAEILTKGTFLTSEGHDLTTNMVQVSFDDSYFNLTSSDIINKYEYKDKENMFDNKDVIVTPLTYVGEQMLKTMKIQCNFQLFSEFDKCVSYLRNNDIYDDQSCFHFNPYTNYSLTNAEYYLRETSSLSLQNNALPFLNTCYSYCKP